MANSGYSFFLASWRNDADDIRAVREPVLQESFGGSWEHDDPVSEEQFYHVLAYDAVGRAVGAARMQPDGYIDYVVVLKPWRGVTVGSALLAFLMHIARNRNLEQVWCDVPESAQRFFARNGFTPATDVVSGRGTARWRRLVDATRSSSEVLH